MSHRDMRPRRIQDATTRSPAPRTATNPDRDDRRRSSYPTDGNGDISAFGRRRSPGDGDSGTHVDSDTRADGCPEPEEVGCDPSEKSDKPLGVATELTGLTVYAGTGDPGFGGDCGPAHAAQVFRPSGIGVDSHGNPYISTDHRIRKVDGQTGTISTIAGTGKPVYAGDNGFAINAQLKSPLAVGVDGAGNIYFVDSGNGRIRRFDTPVLSPVQGPTTNGALVPAHPDPSRRITVSSVEGSS